MNTVAKWSFSLLSLILFSRIKFYCGGEKVDTLVFCGKSIAILLPFITEGASCNWNKNWGGPGTISLFTERKARPSPGRLMNVPVSTRERCLPWSIPSALHCLSNPKYAFRMSVFLRCANSDTGKTLLWHCRDSLGAVSLCHQTASDALHTRLMIYLKYCGWNRSSAR